MSYLKRWRKYTAEVQALAQPSGSDSDDSHQENLPAAENENSGSTDNESDQSIQMPDSENDSAGFQSSTSDSENTEMQSDDNENAEERDLGKDLAKWATSHKCTRAAVNDILDILRRYGHRVTKDARTLLQTPRQIEIIDKCGGQYLYLSVESGLLKVFAQCPDLFKRRKKALLNFNTDGVPLFKSSKVQLWPILCSVDNFEPFVVALYCGNAKPNSVEDYLSDFLTELVSLNENGVIYDGVNIKVTVNAFICDAPARAFLKCTKGHNAYYSCERCTVKGKWHGRVVFDIEGDILPPQRNEEQFNAFGYQDHQIRKSPLIDAGISCINSFALDYMHLACLGVIKRLLTYLKQGPRECKLSQQQVKLISEKMCALNGKMPREFARQPRSLYDMDRWKATEFRQFALYTGPLVLRSIVSEQVYNHFLSYTVALSILLDSNEETRNAYVDYAEELMLYFVQKGKDLYGETFTSYNVHSLIHLADDVRYFDKSLNEVCAFQFENHLQKLKKSVRNGHNPIAQVTKRITEMDKSKIRHIPKSVHTFVSTKKKDGCFLLKNNSYVFVREKRPEEKYVCDVISQRHMESFFSEPCDSKLLNIAMVQNINLRRYARRQLLEKKELVRKAVCLPFKDGCVLLPMLHGVERQ